MSLPGIKFKLWPSRSFHLDINCTRLKLDDGKTQLRVRLEPCIKPGTLSAEDVERLRKALEQLQPQRPIKDCRLDITLSDAFSRCWILPRLEGIANPAELDALAQHQLQTVFGYNADEAKQWVVRYDATPFAASWPAIALPRILLDVCEEYTNKNDALTGTTSTRFTQQINQLGLLSAAHRIIRKPLILVHSTDDCVSIGIKRGVNWLSLRVHPSLKCLDLPLEKLLSRDCRAIGLTLAECTVQSLDQPVRKHHHKVAA